MNCNTLKLGNDLFTVPGLAGHFAIMNVIYSICVKVCFDPSCLVIFQYFLSCSFELNIQSMQDRHLKLFSPYLFLKTYFFFKESSRKKHIFPHLYLMPKHFKFSSVIYIWAQNNIKKVEPKGEKMVCESYEPIEGDFIF